MKLFAIPMLALALTMFAPAQESKPDSSKILNVDAMTFIGFITSPKIQKYIGEFGMAKFKRQINFPLAVIPVRKDVK